MKIIHTENAQGLENASYSNTQKMTNKTWKITDQIAQLENLKL